MNIFFLLTLFYLFLLSSFYITGFSIARKINLSYIHFPISLTVGMTIAVIFFTIGFMAPLPKEHIMVLYLLYVLFNFIFFENEILKLIKPTLQKFSFNSIFLIILSLFLILISSNEPGLWDDTMYHLPYARDFAGNNSEYPNFSFRYFFPLSGEILYSLSFLFKLNEYGAQLISLFPIFIASILLLNISDQKKVNNFHKLIFIISFIAFDPIIEILGYAYIDYFLLLYCGLGSFIFFNSSTVYQKKYGLFFILFSASFKYMSLVFILLFTIFGNILNLKKIIFANMSFFFITILISFYWYFVNYYYVGNPFHPFFSNLFGFSYWTHEDLLNLKTDVARYHQFYTFTFFLKEYFLLILFLPGFLFLNYNDRFLWLIFLFYCFFWFFFFPVNRYLMCGILLLFICLINFYSIIQKKGYKNYLINILFIFIFISSSYNLLIKIYKSINVNNINFSDNVYLIPGRDAFSYLNNLDAKTVYQFGYENSLYYFDGKTFGDRVSIFRYSNFLSSSNNIILDKLVNLLIKYNIGHVLVKNKEFNSDSLKNHNLFTLLKETKQYSIYKFNL